MENTIEQRLAAQGYPSVPIARTYEEHLGMDDYPYAVEFPNGKVMLYIEDGSGVALDVMEARA